MVKVTSPVRLGHSLISAARIEGILLNRSTAGQIEYWSDIGRKVAKLVDPEILLAVQAGLVVFRVEYNVAAPLDPDEVFTGFDLQRNSGALSEAISEGSVRYQASLSQPGYLEACRANGRIEVGSFANGHFIAN